MKNLLALLSIMAMALFLNGCNDGKGSSASPPSDVRVLAGDGALLVTWTMQPGVEYWVFSAAGTGITPQNCNAMSACKTVMAATSPLVISGLSDGTTYSVTIDGRTNGGPGGAGSPSISATPMIAGSVWNLGTSPGTADLHGITYGALPIAVGTGGAMYSSPDGIAWNSVNSGVATDLNAIAYGTAGYVTAGSGGVILRSSDGINWGADASPTSASLSALIANGAVYVAAGVGGTIVYSTDGINWSLSNSGTTNNLYSLAYGNGTYVAVGANGTILTSADAITWAAPVVPTMANLTAVGYGTPNSAAQFVALGAGGTLLTSTDAVTWTLQAPIATAPNLASVLFGSQYVAVGSNGSDFTSSDGINWQAKTSGTNNNLNALTRVPMGFIGVGNAGTNIRTY